MQLEVRIRPIKNDLSAQWPTRQISIGRFVLGPRKHHKLPTSVFFKCLYEQTLYIQITLGLVFEKIIMLRSVATTYMLHFRGIRYPSSPGLTGRLGTTFLQDRHCIEILVALAFIPDADTIIPGIFTRRETVSD